MEQLASDTSSFEGGPPFSAEPHGWGISMSVSGEFQRARSTGVDPADPSAAMNKTVTDNSVEWAVFQSICTVNGCVATGTILDDVNHQESANSARPLVFRFTEGHWVRNEESLFSCGQVNRNRLAVSDDTAQTIKRTTELTLRQDGTLGGV